MEDCLSVSTEVFFVVVFLFSEPFTEQETHPSWQLPEDRLNIEGSLHKEKVSPGTVTDKATPAF